MSRSQVLKALQALGRNYPQKGHTDITGLHAKMLDIKSSWRIIHIYSRVPEGWGLYFTVSPARTVGPMDIIIHFARRFIGS